MDKQKWLGADILGIPEAQSGMGRLHQPIKVGRHQATGIGETRLHGPRRKPLEGETIG